MKEQTNVSTNAQEMLNMSFKMKSAIKSNEVLKTW